MAFFQLNDVIVTASFAQQHYVIQKIINIFWSDKRVVYHFCNSAGKYVKHRKLVL